ncbi:hypothetical protein HK414_15080 [Ramlibacter terrae]|uniref:PBP domain-containing protein n=1 Tax=Ramlibacter terrae TaxID=2732511 RepID=A0ABX6P3B0_9BURK|nr:hypothetical protein HK414_15080 [Ramlibacter terrae]
MKNKLTALSLLCAAIAIAMPAAARVLEVSGATTVQRRVLEPGAEALKAATGIQLKVMGPGTGKGMLALLEGKVPVAAAGESLEDAVASAKEAAAEAGKTATIPANLVYHRVASDNVVVAVHAGNPVKSLTKAQIKDLMTGKTGELERGRRPEPAGEGLRGRPWAGRARRGAEGLHGRRRVRAGRDRDPDGAGAVARDRRRARRHRRHERTRDQGVGGKAACRPGCVTAAPAGLRDRRRTRAGGAEDDRVLPLPGRPEADPVRTAVKRCATCEW